MIDAVSHCIDIRIRTNTIRYDTKLNIYGALNSSRVPICIALYHEQLISKALMYGTYQRGITQFYMPRTRLSTSEMNHTCLYSPQPQSVAALWPVLIFRPAEGRRLSWSQWLVTYPGDLPIRSRLPTHTDYCAQRRLSCAKPPPSGSL